MSAGSNGPRLWASQLATSPARSRRVTGPKIRSPGSSYPLGASFDGGGTNFALFSEVADRIELCRTAIAAGYELRPTSRTPQVRDPLPVYHRPAVVTLGAGC